MAKWLQTLALLALGCVGLIATAEAQTVYENYTFGTLAGLVGPGGWQDGPGQTARFNEPFGLAVDANGNVYVADTFNHTIRKMTPAGVVSTVAGLGGTSGSNDGTGSAASFNTPYGVAVDASGNVYVADTFNHTIRKITPAGVVSTLAGLAGSLGTANGTGSAARFNYPYGVAVDASGNVYVADTFNSAIRKVTPAGVVSTFAGVAGSSGTVNGTGSAARFKFPFGLGIDGAGNLFVADTYNQAIRKITSAGTVSTVAGVVGSSGSTDGTGSTARFNTPYGITVDSGGNIYVGDMANHLIRKITPTGAVTTLAGSAGNAGDVDGIGSAARFKFPAGVGVDRSGNLYVAGNYNHSIRKISLSGEVTTVAGTLGGAGSIDGIGRNARFNGPGSLALDSSGNLYVADTANNVIRKVNSAGAVTTLAGTAGASGGADGTGSEAQFNYPGSVTVDSSGTVYVADTYNHTIRKITATGVVTTLAGLVTNAGSADGTGSAARFNYPGSLAVDKNGTIYVADTYNSTIRKITAAGVVTTLAGSVTNAGSADGTGNEARFSAPFGVAVDASGNVYVADTYNHTIRKVTPAGVVTTLAGSVGNPGSADGAGSAAQFTYPCGMAVDASGNVYVGDTFNQTIRKITPAGVVTTLGGAPGIAESAEGSGSEARFNSPGGLVVDSAGFLYVADAGNHTIRKGNPALPDRALADLTIGPPGVLRRLSVSSLTTTSWTWDFLRYPAASSAQFSSATVSGPTFTPDVPDMYVVRFQGRDNQGRVAIQTLQIGVDGRPPALSITSPKAGLRWSNAVYTVTGQASDDVGVTSVWCQLNGGSWVKANGTTSWSVSLNLSAGTNIVRAYALDGAGHASTTNSVSFVHVPSALVTVQINGNGAVTPNYNGKLLELGKTYKMTATPAAGFAFKGWSGDVATNSAALVFVLRTNLALTATFADAVNPTVAITAPKLNQRWSNAVFTVTGIAKDNARIASVWCQLNSNGWTQAAGTTNWSTAFNLTPGTNTIRAYARDTAGRVSLTNSVKWVYVLNDRLKLLTVGQGTVTPNYSNALLELGRNYTLAAKPAVGCVFSNWMDTAGNVLAETPTLTFTMRSNLGLQATFIPNPFKSVRGNYAGLFYDTNGVAATNSGLFTATLSDLGSFSSKLQITGTNYGLAGRFSVGGGFSGAIPRAGRSPLLVQLHLDLQGGEIITGQISDGAWTAELGANRAVYSKTNPAPLGGKKFTLVIPGAQQDGTQPGGFGFGRVTVDSLGNVVFSGKLSDGSAVAQTTFLSKQGQWPLYQSLYSGKGHLMGWLTINTNDPDSDLSGLLSWIKLRQPLAKLYPAGFEFPNCIEAVGSLFSFTNGVPALNWTRGALFLEGGNLAQSLTNSVQIDPNLKVSSTNSVSLTITNSSGWFQGRVVDPATGKPIVVNGTLLQKQNTGYGYFLGTNSSGRVYLGPQ